MPHQPSSEESEIQAILDTWTNAVRAKDATALTSAIDPNVVMFDLIDPLQYTGAASLKQRAETWLGSFEGPIEYEIRDRKITAGTHVAFCHSLNHVNAINRSGQQIDMFWRATVCFEKRDGQWLITHEHSSVPFNMETMKASLNLKP